MDLECRADAGSQLAGAPRSGLSEITAVPDGAHGAYGRCQIHEYSQVALGDAIVGIHTTRSMINFVIGIVGSGGTVVRRPRELEGS